MGLSRGQFTKEFKLAAVRRLEQGVSLAEAARALEVNPNVLQRGDNRFGHKMLRFLAAALLLASGTLLTTRPFVRCCRSSPPRTPITASSEGNGLAICRRSWSDKRDT